MIFVFPVVGVLTLAALLYFGERTGNARQKWIFKPVTSALFLLTALAGGPDSTYDWVLFAGLVLCFFGDVFLISPERRWFLAGLVSFLLGHVAYIIAFNGLALVTTLHPIALVAIVGAGVGLFLYFRPHLGDMFGPVVVYMVVISVMLASAWAVWFTHPAVAAFSDSFRWLVALGATAFYLSDITVARIRFLDVGFTDRLIGLPLYYLGQFLLALTVGL